MELSAYHVQSILRDHEEVNAALTLIQSLERITDQDYLALTELVKVLLSFKEAMQQVEGEKIVTSSCICPVVVSLLKSMEELKTSNLTYCHNLADSLKQSISTRLSPFLQSIDNRLASLLDPRFKKKWIEKSDEKEEAMSLLITRVAGRLGSDGYDETLGAKSSTDEENDVPIKRPKLFNFMSPSIHKNTRKSSTGCEVQSYFEEDIIPYHEDPLLYWKKNEKRLPTMAKLAKEFLGLTATSAPVERVFSIAGNFYTAKRNLLGPNTFRGLMFLKCNEALYDDHVDI